MACNLATNKKKESSFLKSRFKSKIVSLGKISDKSCNLQTSRNYLNYIL